jgi:hypothetical protein
MTGDLDLVDAGESPRLHARPLEDVSFGVSSCHPEHRIPASGITKPHLIAYGPVGLPIYDVVRALVRVFLGVTEPGRPDTVRHALEQLPEGILEDLGVSITHESVRWVSLRDEVLVSIEGESLREWISRKNIPAPFGSETDPFRDIVFRHTTENCVPRNTAAISLETGVESLQLQQPNDRVQVAGIAPPVRALWYLTQEDRTDDHPYYHCALVVADEDPYGALVDAFVAWGEENSNVLLHELMRLEANIDFENHSESAAWEGAKEHVHLAYSAAEIWSLIGVGVDTDAAVTKPSGGLVLATSWASDRAWQTDITNPIVRTVND